MSKKEFEELLTKYDIKYDYRDSCFCPTLEKNGLRMTCRYDIGNIVPIEDDIYRFLKLCEKVSNE